MRSRILLVCTAIFTVAFFTASTDFTQAQARGRGQGQGQGQARAEDTTDPKTARFGVWVNSTNPNNVMTYEAFEKGGSKLTVSNPSNPGSAWNYVTFFDGVYRPVTGQEGAETAVEIINPKSIRIYNKRNGVLTQVVINTLSEDNNTINNEYVRMDKDGKITGVSHVTYHRKK
jgi:ABC-type sulfate transport system substrate-binding protein